MKRIIFCLILFCLNLTSIFSQTDTTQMLAEFMQKTLKTSEIVPSVSIAIVRDKEILLQKTLGFADFEKQIPANNQSLYYIASCTKAYTGLLAHILAEEGKIDLYAPILNYKPFINFERKEVFEGITILDLITHQSGVDNEYLSYRLAYTGDYSKTEILKLIEEETQKNQEGKAFAYTNFGYYLFDYLLQEELHRSWKELLTEKVFEPLGMEKTTAFISEISKENLALPHRGVFKGNVKVAALQKNNQVMHAAGGLITNVEDAAKFLQFYLDEGKGIYPKTMVLNSYKQQVEAEHEYVRVFDGQGYASGWRIGKFEKEGIVYHFGDYTGYYSHYSFLPEKNIGMVIFSNTDMGMTAANLISKYAYNLYLGNKREVKSAERILNKKVPKVLAKERKAQLAHEKEMSQRNWNLALPKVQYVGTYRNSKYGTVEVYLQGEQFFVKAGNLKSTGSAFPIENSMRVELVPGLGVVIHFDLDGREVVSLSHQKAVFFKESS